MTFDSPMAIMLLMIHLNCCKEKIRKYCYSEEKELGIMVSERLRELDASRVIYSRKMNGWWRCKTKHFWEPEAIIVAVENKWRRQLTFGQESGMGFFLSKYCISEPSLWNLLFNLISIDYYYSYIKFSPSDLKSVSIIYWCNLK